MAEEVALADNPTATAKLLTGHFKGLYRFRVGDYRVVCDIQRNRLVVLVLYAGHRKDVYR